jgi:hypothetical protein
MVESVNGVPRDWRLSVKVGDLVKIKDPHHRQSKGFGIVIGFNKNFDGSNSQWLHIQFPCDRFPGVGPLAGISTMDIRNLEIISESR